MIRKIIPVTPDAAGIIRANSSILIVFDTNGAGELIEVEATPMLDPREALVRYQPCGQVYAMIVTPNSPLK